MSTDPFSTPMPSTSVAKRQLRRHDDTTLFVERFASLTGFHVHSTSIECLPREFLARPVESPDLIVRRFGYELEARTRNALCRFEPLKPHEHWTFGRLLEIRGFGVFSLLDLLEVLHRHAERGAAP
jgi:hypothetical protein